MSIPAIITQVLFSLATVGAPIFYGIAVSRENYPPEAHLVFWLVWAVFAALQAVFFLSDRRQRGRR